MVKSIETRFITVQDGGTGQIQTLSFPVVIESQDISVEARGWDVPQTLPPDPELQKGLLQIAKVIRQNNSGVRRPEPKFSPRSSK